MNLLGAVGGASRRAKSTSEGGAAPPDSNAEALSAAAFALHVRIVEAEGFVETVFDEIDRRAVDEREALRIDEQLHAVILEHHIVRPSLLRVVHDVRKPGAARPPNRKPEPQSGPSRGEERPHAARCCIGKRDGHDYLRSASICESPHAISASSRTRSRPSFSTGTLSWRAHSCGLPGTPSERRRPGRREAIHAAAARVCGHTRASKRASFTVSPSSLT